MPNFAAYSLTEHSMARQLRKEGEKRLAKQVLTDAELRHEFHVCGGENPNSPMVQCHSYEMLWKHLGRQAIFIRDQHTLATIEKLKVDNFDPSTLPLGAWIFTMPKSVGLPSFLFAISTKAMWEEAVKKFLPSMKTVTSKSHETFEDAICYSVSFRDRKFTYHRNADKNSFRADFVDSKALADGTWDSSLNTEENELINRLGFIALKTLVYEMVFPENVVDAPPNLQATTKRSHGKKRMVNGIGGDTSLTAVGLHFRQLRAARYYKGKWSEKPVGTRFVKVNPYVRGAKKVKTIEEEEV